MDFTKYNLEPNSNSYKEAKEKEVVEPELIDIPKHVAVRKEKSLGQKFKETFLEEDARTVRGYILHDVLIPAIKETFRDVVMNSLEMFLFGTTRSGSYKKTGGSSYVNYSGYSIKGSSNSSGYRMDNNRSSHSVDILYFATRDEAEKALRDLIEIIESYDDHFVTVATYYQMNDSDGTYTWADRQWGWSELGEARIAGPVRVNAKDENGVERPQSMYYIVMPAPIPKTTRR